MEYKKQLSKVSQVGFIILWVMLIVLVVLKFTFNYWQPIVINSDRLMNLSYFIDNNLWLLIPLDFIFYLFNTIIISLLCLHQKWYKNWKQVLLYLLPFVIIFPLKYVSVLASSIISVILYILMPLLLTKNKKRWIFITFIIDNVFMFASNFIRGYGILLIDTYIFEIFMQLDYYVMLLLLIGGTMGAKTILPWFGKSETKIKAEIEILEIKLAKKKLQLSELQAKNDEKV